METSLFTIELQNNWFQMDLRRKFKPHGSIDKYKCRLVAKAFIKLEVLEFCILFLR